MNRDRRIGWSAGWPLAAWLLWALPLGVLGAALGSAPARHRRARGQGDLASTT